MASNYKRLYNDDGTYKESICLSIKVNFYKICEDFMKQYKEYSPHDLAILMSEVPQDTLMFDNSIYGVNKDDEII